MNLLRVASAGVTTTIPAPVNGNVRTPPIVRGNPRGIHAELIGIERLRRNVGNELVRSTLIVIVMMSLRVK
jgi:hypothetical protein